jgi:three-Cys-motif partner protein
MTGELGDWSDGDFCRFRPDEIGPWSEAKLDILKKYAGPYCRIVRANGLAPSYIDGFSGAGMHFSKTTGEQVEGSPLRVLSLEEKYNCYHFIDLDEEKA